jgi:hypothetical protein
MGWSAFKNHSSNGACPNDGEIASSVRQSVLIESDCMVAVAEHVVVPQLPSSVKSLSLPNWTTDRFGKEDELRATDEIPLDNEYNEDGECDSGGWDMGAEAPEEQEEIDGTAGDEIEDWD